MHQSNNSQVLYKMLFFKILFIIYVANIIVFGYPTNVDEDSITYGYQELTPEQNTRLAEWTEDSKENIWALSGQFQGDMILSSPEQRNGKFDTKYRWPNKTIPYAFSSDFSPKQKAYIVNSIMKIARVSCIKIKHVTTEQNYVVFRSISSGCSSPIGFTGSLRQYINLGIPGCIYSGAIQHEFLHTVGFHHMQSDSERDDYVKIQKDNIKAGKEGNFIKYPSSEVTKFGEEYDYGSIMHYGAYDFSKNGLPTIVPTKDPTAEIGQREELSESDIKKINKMYDCP